MTATVLGSVIPGAVAEVIAFDRHLTDTERAGIEQYLSEKYGLRTVKLWE